MEIETKDELLEQISLAVEQVVSMRVGWCGEKGGVRERVGCRKGGQEALKKHPLCDGRFVHGHMT